MFKRAARRLIDSTVVGNQATTIGRRRLRGNGGPCSNRLAESFVANRAIDGAGVFVQSGLFKQTGGMIYNNVASNWGGGMLIGSGGTIWTSLGQIISNSAQNSGGGLLR